MRKLPNQKEPFPLQDTVTKVIPAPTDGWDAISPLAIMPANRAPILINWVPRPGWVELRQGFTRWSLTQSGNPVETLMVRRSPGLFASDVEHMFAASGSHIYDVSNLGSATSVVSGLTSARWHYINFTPSGGTTVIQCCNGKDQLLQYNGSAWTNPAITGLPNGGSTTTIQNIYAQKRRIWYILNDGSGHGTSVAAFMPTDAITGAIAGTYDLGAELTKGGAIIAMADWTIDGGAGPNDYAAFLSSQGQVVLYSGTDPTSASSWGLVGVFDLPPPIGDRCFVRIGSDVGVITHQGVLPLSQALPFDPSADRSTAITSRIQNAMSQAALNYGNNFGWQVLTYPAETLIILNVPVSENQQQAQYVQNALTGAWCQINGWNANCFEIYNDALYFGDNNGTVMLAYNGGSDDVSTISADMQCAFNYLDDPGRTKRATMIQPLLTASGTVSPSIAIDTDFSTSSGEATLQIIGSGAQWDKSFWDQSKWPSESLNIKDWVTANGIGHAMAIRMRVTVGNSIGVLGLGTFDTSVFDTATFDGETPGATQLQVNAFNLIIEQGGLI